MGLRSYDTEALYREHGAAVASFCGSLLRDRAEAEDAAQQVFLSAHRALLNGTVPREPLAWLLAVARNECYARFRQRAVAPVLAGDVPDGATADASVQVLRAGELASVWDEVGQLPPAQRDAFLLREIRGLSYGQLAAELSLSPPSVRSLLLRARARLRQRLRDVAALGGAPWLQSLLRLGDGASPVPAAAKAAAVGLGALALVSGGDVARPAHHTPPAPRATTAPRRAAPHPHLRHLGAPGASVAAAPHGARPRPAGRPAEQQHESGAADHSASTSDDGSGGTTTPVPVVQPTTDGHDGGSSGGSSSSGPGPGTSSGSDGGSDTNTTTTTTATTTTTSDSHDGAGSGSHDGGISGDGGG